MAKWRHYELWARTSGRQWEMIGIFPDPRLPSNLASLRSTPSRLIEVLFEGGKMLSQEVIAEIGTTRRQERLRPKRKAPAR